MESIIKWNTIIVTEYVSMGSIDKECSILFDRLQLTPKSFNLPIVKTYEVKA
jgi:hypothetical protein